MKKVFGVHSRRGYWVIALFFVVLFSTIILLSLNKLTSQKLSAQSKITSPASNQVFDPVLPDAPVYLTKDFNFHNDYQQESWQVYANVTDQKGDSYGIQWSYFRLATEDRKEEGWRNPQLYIAYAVVSNAHRVWQHQRVARGGIGQAGTSAQPFSLWIDNWFWRSLGTSPFTGHLSAKSDDFSVALTTFEKGPYVIPGEKGYIKKHEMLPLASHKISHPFVAVQGTLQLGNGVPIVVEGQAWISQEWSSDLAVQDRQGWDWFVFNLDEETTLSVSHYRYAKQSPYVFGTLSKRDGTSLNLSSDKLLVEPIRVSRLNDGRSVPLQWSIRVPDQNIDLTTEAINQEMWLPFVVPFWQGTVHTTGSHQGSGFMQLAGY
ncbi:lipocalin-like domain-containing protein [Vibrio ostreicida]|uniref:Lipocalin-like domain-containing protein n=1 Tax=Vibrio ostreicida TaxID=526588 RepID=A0ABT8BUR3_9VIBR|nr:lipocalin-like domain-containing protein [Vibrio ostreicida]MDN3609862.1 lipocalin-like domain-containing protein [Vibrio ostreicida]NPD09984.1 carotenoid 1,2-hydratase [Vibrio ostreicida]